MTIIEGVFQAKLNPKNNLLIFAAKIDWERIAEELKPFYSKVGRGGKPIRLMVGAHILKHMHGISDEAVAERLCGDVYWMAFCGINEPFATEGWKPLDSSTMTYFRKRIGPDAGPDIFLGKIPAKLYDNSELHDLSPLSSLKTMKRFRWRNVPCLCEATRDVHSGQKNAVRSLLGVYN